MKTKTISILALTALLLGLSACNSVPMGTRAEEPTVLLPLDFEATWRPERLNRGDLSAQDAVALANWTWTQRGSRADYRIAARGLASALEDGNYMDEEERMRLAVICLQHAILSADEESLGTGTEHWERAYAQLNRITYEGESETYLVACALVGREPFPGIRSRTHPAIVNTLNPR